MWEYRRGAPAAPRPTYEVAAQRDFYSKPSAVGEETLDDRITNYEGERFAPLLKRFNAAAPGSVVAHEDATEYLGHLIPRGDHMRRIFGNAMSRFLSDAESFVRDPDKVYAHIGLDDLEPGGQTLEQLRKLIAEAGVRPKLELAQISERSIERLGFALLREHAKPALARATEKIAEQFAALSFDVKANVRRAHTDALHRIGAVHRMPRLESVIFTVEETSAELLLPDCVAIAIDEGGAAAPLTMMERDETALILAPLSPHRMLVGRARTKNALLADADLAPKLASSSHMFFVAATDNFRDLHASLGEVSDGEVDRIISGVFERPRKLAPAEQERAAKQRSFKLNTPAGFGSTEINELGQFISDVAQDIHATTALECLEGITFNDTGSLQDCGVYLVDHGAMDGDLNDGQLRLWVYLPLAVAEVLARESSADDFRLALLVLISALTRVSAASRLNALSSLYFRDFGSDTNAALHLRAVVGALPTYVALASLRPAADTSQIDQMIDEAAAKALEKSDESMLAAKAAFANDKDADAFARASCECVMMIANASAATAGRSNGSLLPFPRFTEGMRERNLEAWFSLFANDLKKFWDEPTSVSDPRSWGIHSERLLGRWGVMTWPVANSRFMVRVFPLEFVEAADKSLKALSDQIHGSAAN